MPFRARWRGPRPHSRPSRGPEQEKGKERTAGSSPVSRLTGRVSTASLHLPFLPFWDHRLARPTGRKLIPHFIVFLTAVAIYSNNKFVFLFRTRMTRTRVARTDTGVAATRPAVTTATRRPLATARPIQVHTSYYKVDRFLNILYRYWIQFPII